MEMPINILHLEDDPDIQRYIATLLSDIASVTPVSTLREARAAIEKDNYNLAIVDFTLPDGSGTSFVSVLAEKYPAIPIIVFSSHEITDTMRHVSHVFVKGRFANADFVTAVHNLCS